MASTSGVDLSLSGLASGLDWKTLVQQLANAERGGEARLQTQQSTINQTNSLFTLIKNQLTTLQTQVDALKDPTLYDSRTASVSDSAVAAATAATGAAAGTYTFNISQLATAAQVTGTSDMGRALSPDGNLSAVTLGTAGFASPVTAGSFTVNGQQVNITTADTLQQVFDKIATATNNTVTASYSTTTDKITLSSSTNGDVILGSASDTSNFLAVAQLHTGTGSVASAKALGSVRLNAAMIDADTTTPITAGAGAFTINGVRIDYNANTDSINNVLTRINNSAAGVTATYDTLNDRFSLTSKTTGDIGIAVANVSGNFLTATGLASPTLTHGKNCLYTLNGDPTTLISQTNTITQDSSGISGLTVTALKENSPVSVTVANDTTKVKTAIQLFVSAYNSVESYIGTQTVSSTDATGKVTAAPLAADRSATDLASSLRTQAFSSLSGLTGALNKLADLGIQTNGHDNTLSYSDASALDTALANHLGDVKTFFSDATNGLATKLDTFLTNTIGDDGSLTTHQASLTKQSSAIDDQIAVMEKNITAESNRWTNEFVAMETAQQTMNQQLQYLTQQVNNGTL